MYKPPALKKKGSAIVLVLIAVVLLFVVGGGLLGIGLRSSLFSVKTASKIQARCAADAGLAMAIFQMNAKLDTLPWSDTSLPKADNQQLPNCGAIFSYEVTGDLTSGYFVESVGKSGEAMKEVRCALDIEGPFDKYALFAQNSIVLKAGTSIEGAWNFPIDEILIVGTNSTGEATIDARAGVTIDGDVVVGVGGDPEDVIDSRHEAVITGQTSALTEAHQLPSVTVPHYLIELPSLGEIKTAKTIFSDARCEGITLNMGEEVTIENDVTFYVHGPISLTGNSQISVSGEPGTSLVLYVKGDISCNVGSYINNVDAKPEKLKIYGLDECTDIEFNTDEDFFGGIYAPNADVKMFSSVNVYGAIIAKSFTQQVAADLYYDEMLRTANPNDVLVQFVVKQWQEE